MKYVVMKDEETDNILLLGRFGGKPDFVDECFSSAENNWVRDNTLLSNLYDGLLEEITEAEAIRIISTQFSREKQAA